jgi:hypothetical protein
VRKTIYTLDIDNYEPAIKELTFPLMQNYAAKIGANLFVIKERKFPEWPVTYEKLQIHTLGAASKPRDGAYLNEDGNLVHDFLYQANDWNIFIDADTLVNPEMFDITDHLRKDTICHNGRDMAGVRWTYDQYFRRDGRHFGSCNWFTVASDWCLDLWRPLDDLTLEEALANIHITVGEHNSGHCKTEHLIDDYVLSRNIARFGLKATTVSEICGNLGWKDPAGRGFSPFLFHLYTLSPEEKLRRLLAVVSTPNGQVIQGPNNQPLGMGWGLMGADEAAEFRRKWGVK